MKILLDSLDKLCKNMQHAYNILTVEANNSKKHCIVERERARAKAEEIAAYKIHIKRLLNEYYKRDKEAL